MRNATIPLARAWNTWSDRPAEMVYLPLGVRVTPVAYSDHLRQATLFPPGASLRFGTHAIDGTDVALTMMHGGTCLDFTWRKMHPFGVSGAWRTRAEGEWGLRFWFNLCLSASGGETVRLVDDAAVICVDGRHVALVAAVPPVQVTGHDSPEALASDYEREGYFNRAARARDARLLALRFNLEMMREGRVAAAVADDEAMAIANARALLREPEAVATRAPPPASPQAALRAIRDVIGWNTVQDPVNLRPYMAISRNWNRAKFGGFGVWLGDQFYHALFAGLFDRDLARENIAAALANATPQGNLACLVTGRDAWVDRSQLPVGAFVVRMLSARFGDDGLAELAYDTLDRNHRWWLETRDPDGGGLMSYGTSAVGEALYRGTSFGARNESSMDNSPVHDEAVFDPSSGLLSTIDVGLNSALALDAECLAALASSIGRVEDARAHAERAAGLRGRIAAMLWDESRGVFANRQRGGGFVKSLSPTSLFPLICGAASEAQAASLLRALDDPRRFGGAWPLPSVTRDDPAFADNRYWRGRVWPPLNFLVWHGLRRYGFHDRARRLAEDSLGLFSRAWDERRICAENYNSETGEPLDQPDTDGFYGWGALLPMMAVSEVMDVNPWTGWTIVNGERLTELGPMQSPAGAISLHREAATLRIRAGTVVLMETDLQGCFGALVLEQRFCAMRLPSPRAAGGTVAFPSHAGRIVLHASLDGSPIAIGQDATIILPAAQAGERQALAVLFA